MHRDLFTNPYTDDETRVCAFIQEATRGEIGCGDDPIGFILASHAQLAHERKALRLSLALTTRFKVAFDVEWDADADVWIITSTEVRGLVLQEKDEAGAIEQLTLVLPALMEACQAKYFEEFEKWALTQTGPSPAGLAAFEAYRKLGIGIE